MTTERIEIKPAVMMSKPVIRGTRITAELILRKLAEGATDAELLEDYPHLKADDIRALWQRLRGHELENDSWPTHGDTPINCYKGCFGCTFCMLDRALLACGCAPALVTFHENGGPGCIPLQRRNHNNCGARSDYHHSSG
jgi:uncharacterized protein (DUF433 family)